MPYFNVKWIFSYVYCLFFFLHFFISRCLAEFILLINLDISIICLYSVLGSPVPPPIRICLKLGLGNKVFITSLMSSRLNCVLLTGMPQKLQPLPCFLKSQTVSCFKRN